ncbi:hypothetical protein CEXT_355011 [Caerostris extrusa]|uniref:Uncharacterized protein n=1 Tax=Caerostris extrusa TaxID=172846 RepID=A0AAV4UQF1_CAEEX|nr:hypothetical protein CEXT_355011 [Caerostris extrusa]
MLVWKVGSNNNGAWRQEGEAYIFPKNGAGSSSSIDFSLMKPLLKKLDDFLNSILCNDVCIFNSFPETMERRCFNDAATISARSAGTMDDFAKTMNRRRGKGSFVRVLIENFISERNEGSRTTQGLQNKNTTANYLET